MKRENCSQTAAIQASLLGLVLPCRERSPEGLLSLAAARRPFPSSGGDTAICGAVL